MAVEDEGAPAGAVGLSDDDLDSIVEAELDAVPGARDEPDDDDLPSQPDAGADKEEPDTRARPAAQRGARPEARPHAGQPAQSQPATQTPPAGAQPTVDKPFEVRASRGVQKFERWVEKADGSVVVPKEEVNVLRQRLASQIEMSDVLPKRVKELERTLQRTQKERSDKEVEAEAVLKLFDGLKGKETDEQLWEWVKKFKASLPKLEIEMEKEKLQRDRQLLHEERNPTLSPEEQREQFDVGVTNELNETFRRLVASEEAKLLGNDGIRELYERWKAKAHRLVVRAAADEPENGIKKGDPIFDDDDIIDDFMTRVKVAQRAQGSMNAADRNAQLNADRNSNSPPPVPAARRPNGLTRQSRQFKGSERENFRNAFLSGELDDPE